jgi:hypothetical protein
MTYYGNKMIKYLKESDEWVPTEILKHEYIHVNKQWEIWNTCSKSGRFRLCRVLKGRDYSFIWFLNPQLLIDDEESWPSLENCSTEHFLSRMWVANFLEKVKES